MSNYSKQPDSLDALFDTVRDSETYLPDDGFSNLVINSLPEFGGQKLASWKKNTLIIGSAALGSIVAAVFTPTINLPVIQWMTNMPSFSIGVGTMFAIAAGLFGLSAMAIWANHKELI